MATFGHHPVDLSHFNFDDHRNYAVRVRAANITMLALVGAFAISRLCVRSFMLRKIFADDILITIAAVFTIVLAAVCLASIKYGMGTHIWLIDQAHIIPNVKSCIQYLFACQILYACAVATTKMSIVASYLRYFPDRTFRIYMYVIASIVFGLWISCVLVTMFQCIPVSAAWDFETPGRCIHFVAFLYASSAINILTDIALCVLPLPHFWRLKLPRRQKISLCGLFLLGAGACIACILRIANLHQLSGEDVTFNSVPSLDLSVLECTLGIIGVSIPPLRPLFVRFFPFFFGQTSRQTTPKQSGTSTWCHSRSGQAAQNYDQISLTAIPGNELLGREGSAGSREQGRAWLKLKS